MSSRKGDISDEERKRRSDGQKKRFATKKASSSRPASKPVPLDEQLNTFLVAYDARLIEIERKYPLGHEERPEWIEAHRANGVRRIREITSSK